jgi:hypothetical protein
VVDEFPDWAFRAGLQISTAPATNDKIIGVFFTDLSFVSMKQFPRIPWGGPLDSLAILDLTPAF